MINRLTATVCAIWLTFAPAMAQMGQIPDWPTAFHSGGATYTGPGNLSLTGTLVKYWGWSCVTAAYSGAAIDLVDTATGSTTGTRLMCSNGSLVALVSASACTFVTGNACSPLATTCAVSCSVTTKYEQIGTADCAGATVCNQTQATNSLRPTYTATGGAGSKPCEAYTSSQILESNAAIIYNQPFSLGTIDSRTGGTSSLSTIFASNGSFVGVYHASTAGNVTLYGGSLSNNVAATDNAFHALQTEFNGASSVIGVDGSSSTVSSSPGTNPFGNDALLTGAGGGGGLTGVVCEEMVFTGANSTADNTTLNSNQHTRFGF